MPDTRTPQQQRELDALKLAGFISDKGRSVHDEMETFTELIYALGRVHERNAAKEK
jgi:hypothetical protein